MKQLTIKSENKRCVFSLSICLSRHCEERSNPERTNYEV